MSHATRRPRQRRNSLLVAGVAAALAASFVAPVLSAAGVNLGFTTSPPNPVSAGTPFPVVVHVQDDAAAPLSGVLVTLGVDPSNNPGSATLSCTNGPAVATNVSGNATFNGCRINQPANGYRLRARASGATTIVSAAFDVEVGPAASLAFAAYPADSTQPDFNPQPVVRILDAAGNVVTADTRTISLSMNKRGSTFSCTGGLSRPAVSGVAAFTGCRQTTIETGYRLTANDGAGGLAAVEGPAFAIRTGSAAGLQFCWGAALPCVTTPPTSITGGSRFPVVPVVRVVDGAGNTIAADDATRITLAIAAGTPQTGGPGVLACTGGLTERVANGVAQFTGCSIDRAGVGYRLAAAPSTNLPAVQSNPFNVAVGRASRLAFVAQPPGSATADTPFGSPLQVAVQDAGGSLVTTGIAVTVRLSLGTNPGGATLTCSGGLDAAAVNGIATFSGCSVSNPGNGYRLLARAVATTPATSLANATSDRFNVLAAGSVLVLSTSPGNGVITWGGTVMLNAHFTVPGAGRVFALQVSRDRVTWSTLANLATDAAGNATFANRPSDNRWYRAVFAGAPDLAASTSATVRVVVRQITLLRPTNGGRVEAVAAGTTLRFSSTVRPNRPELPRAHVNLVVYRLEGSRWIRVLNRVEAVDGTGVARFGVTFTARGSYYVRSQAVPTTFNANSGWSPIERFDVR